MEWLNAADRQRLIGIARSALEARVKGERAASEEHAGALASKRGVFVSIHCHDDLRGCLGRTEADTPLGQAVAHLAAAVADSDPRFPPVTFSELPNLVIELSVLTPPRQVTSIDEIDVGRHGLLIEKGRARGLLLPQVATEYGWTREAFLAHTSAKAGLPRDGWKNDARIFVFEAEVFGEGQDRRPPDG